MPRPLSSGIYCKFIANGNTICFQSCVIILAVNQKSYFLYTKSFNHYSGSQTQLLPMYTHQVLNCRFICLFLTYAVFQLVKVLILTVFCSIPSSTHAVSPKWAFYPLREPYSLLLVEIDAGTGMRVSECAHYFVCHVLWKQLWFLVKWWVIVCYRMACCFTDDDKNKHLEWVMTLNIKKDWEWEGPSIATHEQLF